MASTLCACALSTTILCSKYIWFRLSIYLLQQWTNARNPNLSPVAAKKILKKELTQSSNWKCALLRKKQQRNNQWYLQNQLFSLSARMAFPLHFKNGIGRIYWKCECWTSLTFSACWWTTSAARWKDLPGFDLQKIKSGMRYGVVIRKLVRYPNSWIAWT